MAAAGGAAAAASRGAAQGHRGWRRTRERHVEARTSKMHHRRWTKVGPASTSSRWLPARYTGRHASAALALLSLMHSLSNHTIGVRPCSASKRAQYCISAVCAALASSCQLWQIKASHAPRASGTERRKNCTWLLEAEVVLLAVSDLAGVSAAPLPNQRRRASHECCGKLEKGSR